MLDTLCRTTKNYFSKESDRHFGKYTIEGGAISLDFLQEGQYFRILGSVFNDGVHQYPASDLKDEAFTGAVWAMSVPPQFVALAADIKAFNEKEENQPSVYTSESFGGYSYSKATNSNGTAVTWKDAFKNEINRWRRIRE